MPSERVVNEEASWMNLLIVVVSYFVGYSWLQQWLSSDTHYRLPYKHLVINISYNSIFNQALLKYKQA